jgi:hypothetical protein
MEILLADSTESLDLLEYLKTNPKLDVLIFNFIHSSYRNNFVNEFSELAPEIANEILSFSLDSNCSCSEKLSLYIKLYKEKCGEFLYNFCIKNNSVDPLKSLFDIENLIENNVHLSGKIAKTKISDWESFSKKIEFATYRGFSVLEKGDDLLVFFL